MQLSETQVTWDMTLCRRFSTSILLGVLDREGNRILRNVGNYSPNDTASHPTTPASSATLPCRTAGLFMQFQDRRLGASRHFCCILSCQNWLQPFKAHWQLHHQSDTPTVHPLPTQGLYARALSSTQRCNRGFRFRPWLRVPR